MADKKISQLTGASTPLAGTEVLPVVQSSATVKVSVDNLTIGRTVQALNFYAPSTGATPIDIRRTVANNTCLTQVVDSPSTSNCNYALFGIDTTGGAVGYASGGAFVSTGANGSGTARPLILHTYGNNDIVFARQNTQVGSVSANGFKPIATKGVDYSANTGAAGMTSQLLNWYEEGTWTPSDASGAGLSFTVSGCTYTRVGRLVTVIGSVTFPSTANTSSMAIQGLPFTSSASAYGIMGSISYTSAATTVINYLRGPASSAYFQGFRPNAFVKNSEMSTQQLDFCLTYFV